MPEFFAGHAFSDIASTLFHEGKGILMGYRRGRARPVLSPDEDVKLYVGDHLIMLRHARVKPSNRRSLLPARLKRSDS